jgi:hypothetical protein
VLESGPIEVSRALIFTPGLGYGSLNCKASAKESSVWTVLVQVPEDAAAGDSDAAIELSVLYSPVASEDKWRQLTTKASRIASGAA